MMFRSVKRACGAGGTTIDGGVGRCADVEFRELIKFNVDFVLRAAFALSLDLLGLHQVSILNFYFTKL